MATSLVPSYAPLVETTTLHDKAGVPFTVRPLRDGDRAELERFYEEFSPKRGAQGLPPASPDRIRAWLDSVLANGTHLVADRNGLIGHAFVVPTPSEGIGEYAIFLHERCRGKGVGTEFHRAMIEAARAAGVERLWLTVEPRNRAAVRSYEKAGFRFVPETMYSIEPEMQLELEPAVKG